jgi:DsbC/DsbD-like thiol-disulfide interchange protein
MRKAPFILFLLFPLQAWGAASEWASNEQSAVRLVTPWQVAPGTGELRLGLHFTLAPEWHVYWKNSGDAGFPPVVVFKKVPGLGEPELLWPAPKRFELPGDLVAFGYESEVVYPLRARLEAEGDRLRVEADVDYLVCQVDCIPYRYTLALDQPLGSPRPDSEIKPLLDRWWSRLPAGQAPGVSTAAALDMSRPEAPVLEVEIRGAHPGEGTDLFLESHDAFNTGKPQARTTEEGVVYRVPLQPLEQGKMPSTTTVAWTATGLVHDGRPLALEARRQVGRKIADTPPARFNPLGSPGVTALLAVASALLALGLWGLLAPALPSHGARGVLREILGFGAAAVTVGWLYALSRQVRPEGLAAVELVLLVMGLCAWLRRRSQARRALQIGLLVALLACALAAPWLAELHRLPGDVLNETQA